MAWNDSFLKHHQLRLLPNTALLHREAETSPQMRTFPKLKTRRKVFDLCDADFAVDVPSEIIQMLSPDEHIDIP